VRSRGYQRHDRVPHGRNEFAKKKRGTIRNSVNGMENFWGIANVLLSRFRRMK